MNTPRLWFPPEDYPQSVLGCYDYDKSPDRFIFTEGKPIDRLAAFPILRFTASRSRLITYDVLPNNSGIPLVSPQVASLLKALCPKDIQLIPAQIEAGDFAIHDYSLLNVLTKISGMDHSLSSFVLVPGTHCITSIERLRYADGAMGNHDLAREREYSPFLWVSDRIAKKFAHANFKGYVFKPPEAIHR